MRASGNGALLLGSDSVSVQQVSCHLWAREAAVAALLLSSQQRMGQGPGQGIQHQLHYVRNRPPYTIDSYRDQQKYVDTVLFLARAPIYRWHPMPSIGSR